MTITFWCWSHLQEQAQLPSCSKSTRQSFDSSVGEGLLEQIRRSRHLRLGTDHDSKGCRREGEMQSTGK
ncbi:hypothetical protein R1flu_017145 [Riccia fluitans]|uniref:Uncharacterized protein n=1 Tax=Riccia fluitans TaxID=41844 RepID=A0ABD1YPU5_9MARC